MVFCKKCGGLCVPKKQGDKVVYVCRCCGAVQESNSKTENIVSESIKKDKPKISVFNEDSEKKKLPTVEHVCPKCKNTKAIFWMKQTRRSDEPPTRFYKCTKCGHISREYE